MRGSALAIVRHVHQRRRREVDVTRHGNAQRLSVTEDSNIVTDVALRTNIFMLDQWNNFFVMVGGGAAALAGLIFVAMSVNPENIIRNATHKNRAINMLTGFSSVFMACSFALLGNQTLGALGFEWLFLWLIATVIFVRGYVVAIRSGMSSIGLNAPRLAGGTMCYLAEVIGAVFLILGYGAGLYIAAVATIVLFAFLISGAWLLIIGVYEDQTKR